MPLRIKKISVLDFFCGVGTLSTLISNKFDGLNVFGFEIENFSIEDAKFNFLNNKKNENSVEFHCCDINSKEDQISDFILSNKIEKSELIVGIFDPPRKGLSSFAIERILNENLKLDFIIFVSCHQIKFINDSVKLCQKYEPFNSFLVDLFPQTKNYESVVCFKRK